MLAVHFSAVSINLITPPALFPGAPRSPFWPWKTNKSLTILKTDLRLRKLEDLAVTPLGIGICWVFLHVCLRCGFPVNRGLFSLVFGGQEKKRSLFLPPASTREKRPLLAGKPHLRHTCKKTQQIPMPRGVTARKGTGMLVRKWPRLYLTPKTGKQTRAS